MITILTLGMMIIVTLVSKEMLSLCAEANLMKLKNIKKYLNIGDVTLVDIFPSKVGNILVIISVVNHTPLKVNDKGGKGHQFHSFLLTIQFCFKILSNYFVVSLAIADLMVSSENQ